MYFLNKWWGINEDISPLELAARAAVMFIISALIIRFAGMRSYRKNTPFDIVAVLLIGGILSRGVVGASPFFSTIAGALAIIILHKAILKLSFHSSLFESSAKGKRYLVYDNKKFLKDSMREADVTRLEIYEDLRVQFQTESLDRFEKVYVEKTGEISFIKAESSNVSEVEPSKQNAG